MSDAPTYINFDDLGTIEDFFLAAGSLAYVKVPDGSIVLFEVCESRRHDDENRIAVRTHTGRFWIYRGPMFTMPSVNWREKLGDAR